MDRRNLGLTLLALGIVLAIVSGLAHVIGLSFSASDAGTDTFGWKQVVGVVVGVGVAVAGAVVAMNARGEPDRAG